MIKAFLLAAEPGSDPSYALLLLYHYVFLFCLFGCIKEHGGQTAEGCFTFIQITWCTIWPLKAEGPLASLLRMGQSVHGRPGASARSRPAPLLCCSPTALPDPLRPPASRLLSCPPSPATRVPPEPWRARGLCSLLPNHCRLPEGSSLYKHPSTTPVWTSCRFLTLVT